MPEPLVLDRGPLRVTVGLEPFSIEIRRGRRLIRELRLWAAAGESRDQFIQLTEGMIAGEPPLGRCAVRLADGTRIGWQHGRWSANPGREISFTQR